MRIERFSIDELEKQLETLDSIEEKIELISTNITKCKVTIHEIETRAKGIDPTDIKLITKANCDDALILETLNEDRELENEATKYLFGKCAAHICDQIKEYILDAEYLLEHQQRMLDVKVKCCEISLNGQRNGKQNENGKRIIWKLDPEQLVKLVGAFNENKMIMECPREKILIHFCDERLIPFINGNCTTEKIRWLKSDGSFAVFVDECANRETIEKKNKYRMFGKHFCNKDGEPFKYLAQKKNHTTNFTNTGKLIKKIFDTVLIPVILFFSQPNDGIEEMFDLLKSIS